MIRARKIQFVINTSHGSDNINDSFGLRRATLINRIPYTTTLQGAKRCVAAIKKLKETKIPTVVKVQDFCQLAA